MLMPLSHLFYGLLEQRMSAQLCNALQDTKTVRTQPGTSNGMSSSSACKQAGLELRLCCEATSRSNMQQEARDAKKLSCHLFKRCRPWHKSLLGLQTNTAHFVPVATGHISGRRQPCM